MEHIVLPTFAVEHKLFVGPFARKFPSAKVHVAPRWVEALPCAVAAALLIAAGCILQLFRQPLRCSKRLGVGHQKMTVRTLTCGLCLMQAMVLAIVAASAVLWYLPGQYFGGQ